MDSTQDIEKNVPLGLEGVLKDTPQNDIRANTKFGKMSNYSVESRL